MLRRNGCANLLAALVLAACDPAWILNVEVTAGDAAQAEAGAFPQMIVLALHSQAPGAYVAAVICGPGEEPFTATTMRYGIGCGESDVLEAWLEAKPPEIDLPCGSLRHASFVGDRTPPPDAWRASAPVFEDGRCPERDGVALTLGPP